MGGQGSPRDAEPCAGGAVSGGGERGLASAPATPKPGPREELGQPGPAPPRRLAARVGAGCTGAPPRMLSTRLCPGSPGLWPSPSKSMRPSLFLSPSFIRDSISSSVTCSPEDLKISASSSASM